MSILISFYKDKLKLKDAKFELISHEDSLVAIVYKVIKEDGSSYILKICPRDSDFAVESYFLTYFSDSLLVPRVFEMVGPESGSYGAILMEFLPGNLLHGKDLTESLAYELGFLLGKIHLNRAAGYGDVTKPFLLSQNPAAYFTFKFNESLNECVGHLPDVMLASGRDCLNASLYLLQNTDGPCIIHRDFRPGNVIVNNGKIEGIIDWAAARGGFAEEDLASLDVEDWSKSRRIKKSFISGYKEVRSLPDYSSILPILKLSKAIAVIGFTVKTGTWNNKNESLYKKHFAILKDLLHR